MNIVRYQIDDLFGMFSHEIKFNRFEDVTIIHSPNGYGKTTLLKVLHYLFSKNGEAFSESHSQNCCWNSIPAIRSMLQIGDIIDSSQGGTLAISLRYEGREFSTSEVRIEPVARVPSGVILEDYLISVDCLHSFGRILETATDTMKTAFKSTMLGNLHRDEDQSEDCPSRSCPE